MAKRKLEPPIKWNKEKNAELNKAIKDFNKRVKKLRSKSKRNAYVPEEVYFRATKRMISTETELEDVLQSLKRFKGKEAYKRVTLKSGEELTAWEFNELKRQQKRAKAYVQKELKKENRPYGKMGTTNFQRLKVIEDSIKNFESLKGTKLEIAKERIANYGSTDFEMRRAITYKENYLSMMKKNFQNETYYRKLIKAMKEVHPIDFYENIKIAELGEKLKDISFMYDARKSISF